jgi:hypothetical protein
LNISPEMTYRRFLLGIASEQEECRVEEALLAGEVNDFVLRNVEDELIDDYLLGTMTRQERDGFSANFLTTEERSQRLAFARGLIEFARKQQVQELSADQTHGDRSHNRTVHSWKQAALLAVAASVLLAVLAGFQQMQLHRQAQIAGDRQNEVSRLQTALAAATSDSSRVVTKSASASGSPQDGANSELTLKLTPPDRGIVVEPSLQIPTQAQSVRIHVDVQLPKAVKYREDLVQASSGDHLWKREFPASNFPEKQQTTIVLPGQELPKGSYHFQIARDSGKGGFDTPTDYVFQVVRE